MIEVSPQLLALLQSDQVIRADLLTITPPGLPPITLTSSDIAVSLNGVTYQSWGVRFQRGKTKLTVGMETDTLDLTFTPDPAGEMTINGVPFRQAVGRGLLSGAAVTLQWAFLSSWGPPPVVVETLLRWVGTVGDIKVGRDSVPVTANNPFYRLDQQTPLRVFGPGCRWTFGDAGCGVNLSAYAQPAVCADGSTNKLVVVNLPSLPMGYAGGTLQFDTGVNKGAERTIQAYMDGVVTLAVGLPWAPAAGDQVTAYPGCDKVAPQFENKTATMAVPASLSYSAAAFMEDGGITMTVTTTGQVWVNGTSDGEGNPTAGGWIESITTEQRALVKVVSSPASGQYAVSAAGIYRFAAADAGQSITLSWLGLSADGGISCAAYGNTLRFGGQPYIPVAETAYTSS